MLIFFMDKREKKISKFKYKSTIARVIDGINDYKPYYWCR